MKNIGRRGFLKAAAAAAFAGAAGLRAETGGSDKLRALSHSLLREWCGGLERLQIKSGPRERLGGIKCPACDFIHGRIGDAVYPFLSLAKRDGNSRMLDAGMMLYGWMENNVSQPDGSWINDFSNPWKGTSVFGAISLAEAVKHCGGILEKRDLERMRLRLGKAALFIASFIKFGRPDVKFDGPNINYLAAAAHALALSAEVLDDPKLMAEARKFGRGSVKYITPKDRLVFGETQPTGKTSPNGCKGVDLGYNVEETLPSLVGYALAAKDSEVLEAAEESMKAHIEFMLPDGAWDNSWGTRNFKWTYWGSRTSDGCQAGFAALAGRNPRLYTAALRNLELLESCTENGLLCGGPHFRSGGIPACIHHTFAHAKPLASLLDSPAKAPAAPPKLPPRGKVRGKIVRRHTHAPRIKRPIPRDGYRLRHGILRPQKRPPDGRRALDAVARKGRADIRRGHDGIRRDRKAQHAVRRRNGLHAARPARGARFRREKIQKYQRPVRKAFAF